MKEYIILFFSGPINWKSAKQKIVTILNIEIKLLALTDTVREVYY